MNSILKVIDVCLIGGLLYLIVTSYGVSQANYPLIGFSAAIFYLLLSEVVHSRLNFYNASLMREIAVTTLLWFVVVSAAIMTLFVFKESATYSRFVILSWAISVPIALCMWHLFARKILSARIMQSGQMPKATVIGTGKLANEVKKVLEGNPWLGFSFIGSYDDRQASGREENEKDTIGDYSQMMEDAKRGKFDVVFIALPLEAQVRIMTIIDDFGDTTVTVYMVPNFFLTDLAKGGWHDFAGLPVLGVFDTPFWGTNSRIKRLEDLVIGSLIMALIAIPMLFIALAVKLTSPGPAIFHQKRYGFDGKEISVLKFRSMRVMAEGYDVKQAQQDDQRITPLGSILRKTSLDELPQFLNVLAGSMSIVGPRPHAVSHNEAYRKNIHGYMLRHKVKPGITGWAQINGWRGETDTLHKMEKRIEHDLWYLNNWSLWLDLKTIFITIFKGFIHKNAY
jgi:putative colanic acid biosynthesis UDP-glucose lipid carrier transferase